MRTSTAVTRPAGLPGPTLFLALSLLVPFSSARGQLPTSDAAALGTADNYTALARGFTSLSLNPAGLGMPGTPTWSFSILPVRASQSLDPVSLSDIGDYGGKIIPASVKEDWIQQIAAAGGQDGGGTAEVTAFAFNFQFVGLQFSSIASADATLNEAAAELLLFGNAGRTGVPGDFELQGSRMSGFAVSTLAISGAVPLETELIPGLRRQSLALGATLKRTWGHALAYGEDAGSLALSDPLEVDLKFPVIHTGTDSGGAFDKGTGLGLDVGAAWEGGAWKAAATIQNLFNTFKWDMETMVYRPGEAFFDKDNSESDFDERPVSQAPQALRDRVEELTFKPVLGLGLAVEAARSLTLTAEFRHRTGEGLAVGPKTHLGAGLEYLPAPWLPLRGGVAAITDGFQVGGGLGVVLGPVHLGFAGMLQSGDAGDGSTAMVSVSFQGRGT